MRTNKNNLGITSTDIKILGRAISISVENSGNGIVADALQVWDTGFDKLGISRGTNQNVINDIIAEKIQALIDAGLIPDSNGNINISVPVTFGDTVTFNDDITLGQGVEIGPDLTVSGNITAGHTITGNKLVSRGDLDVTGSITANSADIANDLDVGGDLDVTGTSDLHGRVKAFGDVEIDGDLDVDGDTTVVNLTVSGTLNAPHATTSRYGIVRLASALQSNADDDVVPISLFRQYYQLLLDNPNTEAIDSIKELLDMIESTDSNIPTKLNDLNDVNINNVTLAEGDILYYNGTKWINKSFNDLFDDAIQSYLSQFNNASLWKVSDGYLVPKTANQNVATTGTGKIYSGITA